MHIILLKAVLVDKPRRSVVQVTGGLAKILEHIGQLVQNYPFAIGFFSIKITGSGTGCVSDLLEGHYACGRRNIGLP